MIMVVLISTPIYRYDKLVDMKDLEKSLTKYAEEYKKFMGLDTQNTNSNTVPESIFNLPVYYDNPIATI